MATDRYSKQTTIRLTEAEHEALGAEAKRRGQSLSRYLAAAGLAASEDEAAVEEIQGEHLSRAKREARASSEREALEAVHGQLRRAATQLRALREEARSSSGGGEAPARLAGTLSQIEEASARVLSKL